MFVLNILILLDTKIKLAWNINLLEQNILFKVNTLSNKSPVDIIIGFSDHGSIAGSDFCMYKIINNISRLVNHKKIFNFNFNF